MVDLDVIEANIESSREKCIELMAFMNDKPFMKDKLTFILSTLNSKIKALEAIVESQKAELDEINECIDKLDGILEVKELTRSDIMKQGLLAMYQKVNG